jgi:predicted dienelactone hydrolase
MEALMKVWILLLAAAIVGAILRQPAMAEDSVGIRQIEAPSAARGGNLDVTVWYPAKAGGTPLVLGESMFFQGTSAMGDAPIAEGRFPLILLSHGAGLAGNPQAVSWIAAPLARQGYVVAAPAHPGNSGKTRSAAETLKIWLRPGDLSETLDALEKDPVFSAHLDPGKVGALGLSMGGGTVLALAGARLEPKGLAGYCDTDAINPSLCEWVRKSGVDLHALVPQSAGRDNRDKRIRFAMAIDPAPMNVFDLKSFSAVSIPVTLVNLGRPGEIPVTTQASGAAKAIPSAGYTVIEDASHFSMFAVCKPGAAELAQSEEIGDPICADGGGRSRTDIHAQLIDLTTAAFSRALKTTP